MNGAYGVAEAEPAGDELSPHEEALRLDGYTVLPSALSGAEIAALGPALDAVRARQVQEFGGIERLRAIGDEFSVRAPLAYDARFLAPATDPGLARLLARLLDDYAVLQQQNGLINPPGGDFGQRLWHRDLPYQHFVASRPLAIAALLCIDPFTIENGATLMLRGSHHRERFPSPAAIERLAHPVEAPAGAFIVFDAMLYHRAGENRSHAPRRAVNQVFGRAFLRQQIDLPALLGGRYQDDPRLSRLLGYDDRAPASVKAWREARLDRQSAKATSNLRRDA